MSPATAVAAAARTAPSRARRAFDVAFACEPVCVSSARRITRAHLRLWNVTGELADDIVLVVSELVTNAVEHGTGGVSFQVRYPESELRVEVTDGNSTPAALRPADDENISGRGLFLVAGLASEWGVSNDGHTTWCAFHIPEESG